MIEHILRDNCESGLQGKSSRLCKTFNTEAALGGFWVFSTKPRRSRLCCTEVRKQEEEKRKKDEKLHLLPVRTHCDGNVITVNVSTASIAQNCVRDYWRPVWNLWLESSKNKTFCRFQEQIRLICLAEEEKEWSRAL